jgi:hypothetical protein
LSEMTKSQVVSAANTYFLTILLLELGVYLRSYFK